MVIFLLAVAFVALLIYSLYIYTVQLFVGWVYTCIGRGFLRILLYIAAALYVIIPHALFISLIILIL